MNIEACYARAGEEEEGLGGGGGSGVTREVAMDSVPSAVSTHPICLLPWSYHIGGTTLPISQRQ